MRTQGLIFSILIAGILGAAAFCPLFAQKQNKIKQLDNTIEKMELDVRDMSDRDLLEAIKQNENLLIKYSSFEFSPTVLYQLSELHIRKARQNYENKIKEYEIQYTKHQNKEIELEPSLPRVNFGDAINYLYKILDNYENVGFIDKVLYRLALCHQEEENSGKSIEFFERLLVDTPNSSFVAESYFRLGEHYFNQGKYQDAVKYYKKLSSGEMWSNPFYNMSLYKLGWANYNLNKYPEAISFFMSLLNDIDALERLRTQKLDRNALDLRDESLVYVAVCFSEFGDSDQAVLFLNQIKQEKYKNRILSEMGNIYIKQDRLDEAIRTYNYLIKEFPKSKDTPKYAVKIIETFEKKWDLAGANQARGELIKNFSQESEWYNSQTDSTVREETLRIVKDALFKKGVYHQVQAREANEDIIEYQKAVEQYSYFLDSFADDSSAYKVSYFLAECYYALEQFEMAAEEYKKVYLFYPQNDYVEEAAYSSVLSYYKASKLYKTTSPQKFKLQEFFGFEGEVTIEVGNPATQQFILACNDILKLMPENLKIVDVLMKEAEVLNEINRYDLARRVYFKIVQDYPYSSQFEKAAALIAQSYFQEEDYQQAEKWYNTVVTMLPDTSDLVRRAKVRMASSHFKMAEKARDTGEFKTAAKYYVEAAMRYPESQIAELAIIEAGNVYESQGDTLKAALVFEDFIAQYPESNLVEMCVLKAAKSREAIHSWEKAAENYLILRFSNSSNRIPAIYKAGICYFNAKKWRMAIDIFNEYCQISDDHNQIIAVLCKTGLSYYELINMEQAKLAFRKTVRYYQEKKPLTTLNTYYVAQAQFMLGEIGFIRFANIELVPPLRENLNRKSEVLKEVLKEYAEASKFRVAEWTTGSSYKIGQTFEELANAIIISPSPENMTAEEIVEYEQQLKNIARDFQKKAMEAYQANVKQAEKNQIRNRWVTLSKSHLSMLSSLLNTNIEQN